MQYSVLGETLKDLIAWRKPCISYVGYLAQTHILFVYINAKRLAGTITSRKGGMYGDDRD